MKIVDPGHSYTIDVYDAPIVVGVDIQAPINFMKREGPAYPFNKGTQNGTNCQELLRVLINRVEYLDSQLPAPENAIILNSLRNALWAFEIRAARRHGREISYNYNDIEKEPYCRECGHIQCGGHHNGND